MIRIICKVVLLFCTVVAVEIKQALDESLMHKKELLTNKPTGVGTGLNCSLFPEFSDQRDLIAKLANDGNKLVKVMVKIIGEKGLHNETVPDSVYSPNHWVLATSITGKSMLMLKEYFDAMSLMTLGHGVEKTTITLIQKPAKCLKGLDADVIENLLRMHFLNNFNADKNSLPVGIEICNSHVVNLTQHDGRVAYVCCNQTVTGLLHCSELQESIWLTILFTSEMILQVVIILYSPMLLPSVVYNTKTVFEKFIFETEPEVMKFNVKIVDECAVGQGFVKAKQQSFTKFTSMNERIPTMRIGYVYTMYTNKINLRVRMSKLVASGNAPVTMLNFLRHFLVRCKIREEVPQLGKCCNANMCTLIPKTPFCPWFKFLQIVMIIVVTGVFTLPWTLRIWFYYSIEDEPIKRMTTVMTERNFSMPYPGNLVSYLSPIHPVFITIYSFITVQILVYVFMKDSFKRKIKYIMRKCLRDMRDTNRASAVGIVISWLMWPLRKGGIIGCIIWPVWLILVPLCILLLSVEIFPIVNLSARLLINFLHRVAKTVKLDILNMDESPHFCGKIKTWMREKLKPLLVVENADDLEENSRIYQSIYAFCIILTFLSMALGLVLLFECISFYVECAVYTFIGFILNPGDTMKYVSLLLLIAVYGNDCFSSVNNKYCEFSKEINSEVQNMVGQSMEDEAAKPDHDQENAAFRIPSRSQKEERLKFVIGSEKYLKINVPRLAMFLDKSDVPYLPKSFLFQMAKLPHYLCPGKVHMLYLKAFRDFSIILIFLFFVFIVIFAFGQAHDISSGGQAIAALGSGFLPLVLRKFLFQSHDSSGFDKSNLKWKNMFANKVQEYVQRWNFEDIIINDMREAGNEEPRNDIEEATYIAEQTDVDLLVQVNGIGTYSFFVPGQERTIYRANDIVV